jgi:hypothetical protein
MIAYCVKIYEKKTDHRRWNENYVEKLYWKLFQCLKNAASLNSVCSTVQICEKWVAEN